MAIISIEERMKGEGKHLIKTSTILSYCEHYIDIEDDKLREIGIKQVIQSRLYAHGYFSVQMGYFVNVAECENIWYLQMIISEKDEVLKNKTIARNRLKELMGFNGQVTMIPDESGVLVLVETKTKEEIMKDLEADAV